MANTVTATIKKTVIDILVYNLDKMDTEHREFSLYGEPSKEIIEKYAYKTYSGALNHGKADNVQFLSLESSSFSSDLREMPMDDFIILGKVLGDDDSKLGMITRTVSQYKYLVKAVDWQTEEMKTLELFIPVLKDDRKIKKALQEECELQGAMYFSTKERKLVSALLGLSKSEFIAHSTIVERKDSK